MFAVHRCPGWNRVPAAEELLILLLVATAAIGGSDVPGNFEIVVRNFFLIRRRPMALQAINALFGVHDGRVLAHPRSHRGARE